MAGRASPFVLAEALGVFASYCRAHSVGRPRQVRQVSCRLPVWDRKRKRAMNLTRLA